MKREKYSRVAEVKGPAERWDLRFLYVLLWLTIIVVTSCRRLSIEGIVVNKENKHIAGAVVQTNGGAKSKTDAAGRFVLEGIRVEDTIIVKAKGYRQLKEVIDFAALRTGMLLVVE